MGATKLQICYLGLWGLPIVSCSVFLLYPREKELCCYWEEKKFPRRAIKSVKLGSELSFWVHLSLCDCRWWLWRARGLSRQKLVHGITHLCVLLASDRPSPNQPRELLINISCLKASDLLSRVSICHGSSCCFCQRMPLSKSSSL